MVPDTTKAPFDALNTTMLTIISSSATAADYAATTSDYDDDIMANLAIAGISANGSNGDGDFDGEESSEQDILVLCTKL